MNFALVNRLVIDEISYPFADIGQECFNSLVATIHQQLDAAIGKVSNPASNGMVAGYARSGDTKANTLNRARVVNEFRHRNTVAELGAQR